MKGRIVFTVLGLFLSPLVLQAQYACGENFELQFASMNVWGNDISREYVDYESILGPNTSVLVINERRQPISIATGRGIALRGEFVKSLGRKCEWFLGIRGWLFSGTASVNDTARFDPALESSIRGVRMWDDFYFQNFDDRREGGLSEIVSFSGNRNLVWIADLLATRRLGNNPKISAAMHLGLRLGSTNFTEVNAIQNEAFERNYFPSTDSVEAMGLYYILFGQSESKAEYSALVGPLFGFGGTVSEGKMRIRGSFTQSFVLGNVNLSGQWMDFREAWFVKEMEEGELRGFLNSREIKAGELSGEERVFLPITELSLDVSFTPKKRISLGGGVFVSTWFNAPVPATWSASSFDWEPRERTLIYGALTVVGIYRF